MEGEPRRGAAPGCPAPPCGAHGAGSPPPGEAEAQRRVRSRFADPSSSPVPAFADATVAEPPEDRREPAPAPKPQVKFNLRSSPDAEETGCALAVGQHKRLEECEFNVTAKTFFIIHGWTVSYGGSPRGSRRCLAFGLPAGGERTAL